MQELEQGLCDYVADKISISYHYQAGKALKDFGCKALCFPKRPPEKNLYCCLRLQGTISAGENKA